MLTAVPQRGGSGGVFGCFFALPDAYPGVLFFAGDVYGEGSNGKLKTDVSSECTPRVNKTLYSRMEVFNCKGLKGIPAGQTVKRDPPAPPRQVSQSERSQEPAPQRNRQQTRNREPANEGYDWVRAVWDIGSGG